MFSQTAQSSLKCFTNPNLWIDALPLVLLRIRTALKAGLNCTPAELFYGVTLRLPGQFFAQAQMLTMLSDPLSYVNRPKEAMQSVQYQPTHTNHSSPPLFTKTCKIALMCLSDEMPGNHPCNQRMMAPSE